MKFAIGIDGMDLTDTSQYFAVQLEAVTTDFGQTPVVVDLELEPCSKSVWESYDSSMSKLFDAY